jgi:hypothetical protein
MARRPPSLTHTASQTTAAPAGRVMQLTARITSPGQMHATNPMDEMYILVRTTTMTRAPLRLSKRSATVDACRRDAHTL